jgi:hypothetical protein
MLEIIRQIATVHLQLREAIPAKSPSILDESVSFPINAKTKVSIVHTHLLIPIRDIEILASNVLY